MIGPNCMGVVNTDPDVRLNATFSPAFPPPGSIALSSQSGALGLAILEYAKRLNLGMSHFVSIGNKADVSTNDLIEFWADDARTRVILLYVESFGNPRRFSRIARRVARTKPIVALKAGRSLSGARAASSHTGALAASDNLVDALFEQCGVIRTDTLEELFDVARLLAHQPAPADRRVAILTNAGGPGILAADACEALGLTLPRLSPATAAALRAFLPASAGLSNPVDMLATASAGDYARAIPLLLDDASVDSLLTIFIPPLVTDAGAVAGAIHDAARHAVKPVMATFLGAEGVADTLAPVPCYRFPESAAHALARAVAYRRWRERPAGQIPSLPGTDPDAARRILERARLLPGGWLPPSDAASLLETFGIPHAPLLAVTSEADAAAAAERIGFPVVLKGAGAAILHKTEARAVHPDLRSAEDVRDGYRALAGRTADGIDQILLQPMITGGVEFLVGVTFDVTFGHVIVCGLGGTLVEVLRDTALRLHPLTDRDAGEMIDGLRGAVLLRGFRGGPVRNEAALRDVLLRVSALVEACPAILELDLNPVIVTTGSAVTVDVRIRVQP
jgi:acyl-CoA synthetase (NDP forming)